jgi:tetratricopeptide (TPR) repeat protein
VLPFGHETKRFQLPGHLGRQLSREPLGGKAEVAAAVSFLRRLKGLIELPRELARASQAVNAWGRQDWHEIVSLLEPHIHADSSTSSELLLLGIAHTGLGQFDQAFFYFDQIDPEGLITRLEEPVYTTHYAHLLSRVGRSDEACELLRRATRKYWHRSQRRWADDLLARNASSEAAPSTRLHTRRGWLH